MLIGGEPGAGKSVAASMLLAAVALDPGVRLLLCDGALVELAAWRACADRFVGPDPTAFLTLLGELRQELDRRLGRLLDQGQRKVHPGDGLPLVVVVIDELAFYLNTGTRKLDDQIEDALRDLVARGRKTGIIVLAATQRPSFDVVPTSIRDLFAYRWAFRCTTPEASDTILGRGHASLGYSASDIPAEHRGVAWLRSEGTTPRRLRTHYLTDPQLGDLAARARQLRHQPEPSDPPLVVELHRLDGDDQEDQEDQDGEHGTGGPQ
jgi:S-DNA-T family DNA segregation ATPase FtsK/SpoIIIE